MSRVGMVLTPEAQADRDEFEAAYDTSGNCSCHISSPCGSCTHPGNPCNQEECDECWMPDPDIQGAAMTQAALDVMAERKRQQQIEGWTPEHDDQHEFGEMASAAGCYAMFGRRVYPEPGNPPPFWPWAKVWWKPGAYRRNLVKACALLLAEIERLDRQEGQ